MTEFDLRFVVLLYMRLMSDKAVLQMLVYFSGMKLANFLYGKAILDAGRGAFLSGCLWWAYRTVSLMKKWTPHRLRLQSMAPEVRGLRLVERCYRVREFNHLELLSVGSPLT